ncbi:MAG TPA: hypothetical protein VI979_01400 [archaeon]|nr:hypothetical protein [archaeon]
MNIKDLARNTYTHAVKPAAKYAWTHKSRAGPAAGGVVLGAMIGAVGNGSSTLVDAALLGTAGFYGHELFMFAKTNPKEGVPAIATIFGASLGYPFGEFINDYVEGPLALAIPPLSAGVAAYLAWEGTRNAIRNRYP